ncbi:hypothetical protein LMG33818_002646 [Halomonadaceae bacterium LMG 33818]|uniref:hypothetical protein n=1 Tax=Cernens ardua TaxID=3402176 RepID=UPI003EDC9BC7
MTIHRQRFVALRDELRERATPTDLADVWKRMNKGERAVVLQSAGLSATHLMEGMDAYSYRETVAIRDAIKRMSLFASDLMDYSRKAPCQTSDLARQAREALDSGDMESVKHFLAMIESMA